MFGGPKIKVDKDLYDRAAKFAQIAGYTSVDEFVAHMIEKELSMLEEAGESEEEIKAKLRGLGYIS